MINAKKETTMKYINKIVIFTLVISIIFGGIYVPANADAAINKGTVRFSVKNHKIKQGHSVKINIIKRNVRGSLKVKMKSSNQKILQVKKNRVTGMNPGKATVRLSYTLNGKKKIRNIKFLVTASNKAVAVTTGTAFNPNKSHYDEDKLQEIMAGYDNQEYFDFNNYPNKVNWKTLKEEADSYVKEFCKNRGYDVKMFSSDRGIASRYELVDEFTIE